MKWRHLLILSAISLLLLIPLFAYLLFSNLGYERSLAWAISSLGKPEVESLLREKYFTQSKFQFALWSLLGLGIAGLGGIYFVFRMRSGLIKAIHRLAFQFETWLIGLFRFSGVSRPWIWAMRSLILLFILKALYYVFTWDIQYDEAWTYNYYLDANPILSLVNFNAHPLYAILARPFCLLPFEMVVNMRLPVVLFGALSILVFWKILKLKFSTPVAFLGTVFFAFSAPVCIYSLYARAYILVLFFSLLALWALLKMVKKPTEKKFHILFGASITFGFYAVPTFLYPALVLSFLFLMMNWQSGNFWQSLKTLFFTGLGTILIYTPMLLGVGLSPGSERMAFTHQFSFEKLVEHLALVLHWTGGDAWSWIPLLLLTGFLFYRAFRETKTDYLLAYSLLILFTLPFTMLAQNELLMERLFIYLIPAFVVSFCLVLQLLEQWLSVKRSISLGLFLMVGLSLSFHKHYAINWSKSYDLASKEMAAAMMEKQVKRYYLTHDYHKPNIEFYFRVKGKSLTVVSSNPKSQSFGSLDVSRIQAAVIHTRKKFPVVLDRFTTVYEGDDVELRFKK